MGLTNSQSNFTFLSVFNGKLTRKVKEGTEGAVSRENKKGDTVWELTYDNLSGMLIGVEFRDGDYGKEIHFLVEDGIDVYKLQCPFSSAIAKSFVSRLPNCKLKEPIEIRTGWDKEKEKGFSYIKQDGKTVPSAYSKDNPNGLPPMIKQKVKGKETWDDSDQLEFLEKMLAKDIIPQFTHANTPIVNNNVVNPDESTDLPF
jgi:hypothetical protein